MITTNKVLAVNLPAVQEKLDKLARDAERYNLPAPRYEVLGTEVENGETYVTIQLTADPKVGFEGWLPVGVMEFRTSESPTVQMWPGQELDTATIESITTACDLCEKNSYRIRIYIFRNEAGEIKQVGSTCVKLFFGVDPAKLLNAFRMLEEAAGAQPGKKAVEMGYLADMLTIAAALIRTRGYTSRRKAYESGVDTTRDLTARIYRPWSKQDDQLRRSTSITQEDRELAEKAIAYTKTIDANGSYEYNLRTLAEKDLIEVAKDLGYAVSIIPFYTRKMEAAAKRTGRKVYRYASGYEGEVKERIKTNVKVEFTKLIETDFGITTMVKMKSAAGRQLIWWATNSPDVAAGERYELLGSVKKHGEYNGIPQTIMTRCKLTK